MKLFHNLQITIKDFKEYRRDKVASRSIWMPAVARNAARQAIHYYACKRTIGWYRIQLDKAEKSGNKYMSLAELMLIAEKENEKV